MNASSFSSGKVVPRISSQDREFENLLQRAADFLKNRRSSAGQRATEAGEPLQRELDSET